MAAIFDAAPSVFAGFEAVYSNGSSGCFEECNHRY